MGKMGGIGEERLRVKLERNGGKGGKKRAVRERERGRKGDGVAGTHVTFGSVTFALHSPETRMQTVEGKEIYCTKE